MNSPEGRHLSLATVLKEATYVSYIASNVALRECHVPAPQSNREPMIARATAALTSLERRHWLNIFLRVAWYAALTAELRGASSGPRLVLWEACVPKCRYVLTSLREALSATLTVGVHRQISHRELKRKVFQNLLSPVLPSSLYRDLRGECNPRKHFGGGKRFGGCQEFERRKTVWRVSTTLEHHDRHPFRVQGLGFRVQGSGFWPNMKNHL